MSKFPSVTTVLRLSGFYDELDTAGEANREVGLNRGSALHKACHHLALYPDRDIPWKNPHPELDRFIDGFRSFQKQHDWRVHEVESEWINEDERLVAHPDSYGMLDDKLTVLEIKTGALPAWVGLQTAGQLIARRWSDHKAKRMAISLPGDGSYKLKPLTDYRDFAEFRTLLHAVHIRAKYQGEVWQ